MRNCPKCKSAQIRLVEYIGAKVVVCSDCGFDEREQFEVYPEEKISQKEKGRHSPYKTGGSGRKAKKN